MVAVSDLPENLDSRVLKWFRQEGYPLEFSVAHLFSVNRFVVRQGEHVKDEKTGANREVDVIAHRDCLAGDNFIRIYHVVECKWSADKPWVVFTADKALAPAACVAQTIASELAGGILWKDAGLENLHSLSLFATPSRSGFGGRQAFSTDNNDRFFSALKSVVSLSTSLVARCDMHLGKTDIPRDGAVAFPLIVVQGPIYEAYFDTSIGDVRVDRVDSVRCHWRGSPDWKFHSTVDVVSFDALPQLLQKRANEVENLQRIFEISWESILRAEKSKSVDKLLFSKGGRRVGTHRLFRKLLAAQKSG